MSFLGTSLQGTGLPRCHGSQSDASVASSGSTTVKGVENVKGYRYAKFMLKCANQHTVKFYEAEDGGQTSTTGLRLIADETRTGRAGTTNDGDTIVGIKVAGCRYVYPVVTNTGATAVPISWYLQFYD